jgi:hypothetical protein
MKIEREEKKPENKEGAEKKEDASKRKGLKRWGAILPVTAALMTAGVSVQCGDPGTNEPPMWEENDGGVTQDGDAKTDEDLDAGVDGDVDVDGGDVTDAGADEDLDAGVDGDVDVDGGDVTDAGADEDLDAGVDGDVDVDGADVSPDEDLDGSVETDEDVDAGVDGDVDVDGGDVTDAGADEDLDAGVDAGTDEDVDGADVGPDEDIDAGLEDGDGTTTEDGTVSDGADEVVLPCPEVFNDEIPEVLIFDHTPLEIGGYSIALVGAPLNAALVDIKCVSSSTDVVIALRLPVREETTVEIPQDNKKIRIYVYGRCSHYVGVDVTVEDL